MVLHIGSHNIKHIYKYRSITKGETIMSNNRIIQLTAKAMIILVLMANILTLSGCNSIEKKYRDMGYDYYLDGRPIIHNAFWGYYPMSLVVLSKTNTFNKNDITFDIAYNTCNYNDEGFICYGYTYLGQKDKYFTLYLCPYGNAEYQCLRPLIPDDHEEPDTGNIITKYPSLDDIQSVKDHIFLNGISGEMALTKDYAYSGSFPFYHHIESITIPWSYLKEHKSIGIMFVCFYYEESPEIYNYSGYSIMYDVCVNISYKEIDENTIELNFNKIS